MDCFVLLRFARSPRNDGWGDRADDRHHLLPRRQPARVCPRAILPGVAALRALPRAIDIVVLRATDRKLKHTVMKVASLRDAAASRTLDASLGRHAVSPTTPASRTCRRIASGFALAMTGGGVAPRNDGGASPSFTSYINKSSSHQGGFQTRPYITTSSHHHINTSAFPFPLSPFIRSPIKKTAHHCGRRFTIYDLRLLTYDFGLTTLD